jgi:hypothetical protein
MNYYFIKSNLGLDEVSDANLYYETEDNLVGKYQGKVLNGLPHGSGNINFSNGDEYFGTLENGVLEGEGVFIEKNGDKYTGNFTKGKKNGYGTLKSTNGETYEGEWKDDVKCGGGVFNYTSGDVYKGFWENDKYSGEGYLNYSNGDQYIGYWKYGKREGKGKLIKANGEVLEGEWIDNDFQHPNQRDPLFNDAARIVIESQQGSTSLVQRKLSLGYNRASKIIDQLEAAGIVGPFEKDKARSVLVANLDELEKLLISNGNGLSSQKKEPPQSISTGSVPPTFEDFNNKSIEDDNKGRPKHRLKWLSIVLPVVLLLATGGYFLYPSLPSKNKTQFHQLNDTTLPLEAGGYKITFTQNRQISKGTFDITNIKNEIEGRAIINVYSGPLNSTLYRQELKFSIEKNIIDIERIGKATIFESNSLLVLKSVDGNEYDFEIVQIKFD